MRQFKKKTIALVLASVVTVVGAFGAENYKNSLMSLKFDVAANGSVNLTLLTKKDYAGSINLVKRDASTYVIMLPDTNSEMSGKANLVGGVQNYNISTMPYTTHNNGYTKITIKTAPNIVMQAKKALYVASQDAPQAIETQEPPVQDAPLEEPIPTPVVEETSRENPGTIRSQSGVAQTGGVDIQESVRQFEQKRPPRQEAEPVYEDDTGASDMSENSSDAEQSSLPVQETSPGDIMLFVLGFLLVVCIIVYLFIRAKNNMKELLGDQPELDLSDEEPKKDNKKKEKIKKIQKTVKSLDKKYTKPEKMPVNIVVEPAVPEKIEDEPNIVDLDELFQEKNKEALSKQNQAEEEDDENLALEEFLAAYSFDDEDEEEKNEEAEGFNETLYEKYIQDDTLRFSNDDVDKINKLLNSEINDSTLRNIEEYAAPSPKEEKKRSTEEVLQDLVTDYAINQNISFTKEDIEALNKLISVELDEDFITDLKTDPDKLREKAQEITSDKERPHKTSELLTLNVKDMLPDLSEALKKQGGRRIESEVKPSVVYYSEGYDVSILSLKDKLPDLSIELNNKDAYKSRPSDEIQYAESGYDVAQMHIANELPDLRDALKHPEKYEKKPEKPVVADEASLLERITNVSFKPFYDGSTSFDVVNEFDDSNAPSVSDVQKEFNQFGDLEIVRDDDYDVPASDDKEYDDFASLYDNKYFDFDKQSFLKDDNKTPSELDKELDDMINKENEKSTGAADDNIRSRRDDDTERLIKSIEEKQNQKDEEPENIPFEEEKVEEKIKKSCLIDGIKYDVVSECDFTDNIGCYLAKNSNGYTVIGFSGDNTFTMKQYDSLDNEKIRARASEELDDGAVRYIVRVDNHKFIVNVSGDKLEYVMDLC